MRDLIEQERFELETLEKLNSKRLLEPLVFCGGTMLRLCFGLNRYSVDLDFWIIKSIDENALFEKIKNCLSEYYNITDGVIKHHTILFEIKSKTYPRALKIEIRNKLEHIKTERAIAYSVHSNIQVYVKAVSLEQMMQSKIEAFLSRGEIRDAFDIEFLLKKGISLPDSKPICAQILKKLELLQKQDYKVKLGSLLEPKDRVYYSSENFKIIKMAIKDRTPG